MNEMLYVSLFERAGGDSYYVYIEDLAANAFIELNGERNMGIKELSLSTLENYGAEVVAKLREKGKKSAMILSKAHTNCAAVDFREYFTFDLEEGKVILNDNISTSDLIERFRGFPSWNLMLTYMHNDIVEKGLMVPLGFKKDKVMVKKKKVSV